RQERGRVEEGQDEKPKRPAARSSKGLDRGRGQRSSGQRPSGGVVGSESAATSSLASFKTVSLPSWLPAWHTILDVIGCLLTNRCQLEKLLLYGWVFGRFGKLPILGRLVPQIIGPIHAAPSSTYLVGSGGE